MKIDLKLLLINTRISRMERKLPPLVSAKLFFYESETTQPKGIFMDSDCEIASPNPVIADHNADFPDVFFDKDDNGQFRVVLQDCHGEWLISKEYK